MNRRVERAAKRAEVLALVDLARTTVSRWWRRFWEESNEVRPGCFPCSQTTDYRLECMKRHDSFWFGCYSHVVVRSCRDQLLAKWGCTFVRFGTLKECLSPWNWAEYRSNAVVKVYFSEKILRKILFRFIDKLQAFSRRLLFGIRVPADMFECDSNPTCYSAIISFVVKKNFLFHFIGRLFESQRAELQILASLSGFSGQQGIQNWCTVIVMDSKSFYLLNDWFYARIKLIMLCINRTILLREEWSHGLDGIL